MKPHKFTRLFIMCWLMRWIEGRMSRRSSTSTIERDGHLPTPDLISAYGYPSETHRVTTDDGYILTLHRIPREQSKSSNRVVFLQHGLLSSSSDWVIMGPGKGLAYILSDCGYDVWMGNARGNTYSKDHEEPLSQQRYWSFSFHEMGVHDLPAVIDFILNTTGKQQLHYVGHSMGTTMFFVMASELPEYNKKIKLMVSLAPVAFLGNLRSGFLRFIASYGDQLGQLLLRSGYDEFQPNSLGREFARTLFCSENPVTQDLCTNLLLVIAGFDSDQLNRTMLPVILSHLPAGTSTKVVLHYAQLVKYGKFQQMDFGDVENRARYGEPTPPSYNLGRITAPIALFTADNDHICSSEDVEKLKTSLDNVIGHYRVPYSRFNHLDFLYAKNVKTLLYDEIIRFMDQW